MSDLLKMNRKIWYSSATVYSIFFGCPEQSSELFILPVFPDVGSITAVAENNTHTAYCTFSLLGELIEARGILTVGRSDEAFFVQIFAERDTLLLISTTICKTGKVRNGSCSSLDADGSPYTGVQVNQRFEDRYDVRYQVTAVEGEKHRCMVSIDGMSYFVDVRIRVDLNECEVAAAESVQICQAECHNLFPGYRCANNSYSIPCAVISREGWTCLPDSRRLYPPLEIEHLTGSSECETAANTGQPICLAGIHDCVDSPDGPFCHSEETAAKTPGITANKSPNPDMQLLLRKVATDKNLTYLLSSSTPILYNDADKWIEALGNVSVQVGNKSTSSLFEFHDEVSPENLLQSIDLLLNLHTQEERFEPERNQDKPEVEDASDARKNATAEPLSVSAIVRSALALFDLYSTLSSPNASGSTPSEKLPGEFSVSRHGLELRRIQAQQGDALNESHPVVLQESSNHSDLPATALVMTIPSAKLRPYLPEPAAEAVARGADATSLQSLSELESDLYLIRSSSRDTMVRLKLAASKERQEDVVCRLWDVVSSNGSFPRDACETRWYGGREYVCECLPPHTGTFAVGLVFIINSGNLKNLKKYGLAISVVNYVCSGITIVALSFFLFFTRFVGVFRLDQFHIALCLLLSTIIALFVPHVSEKSVFLCTSVAIFVNFFPLCAFAWKFICGLTALLMVVAPYSRFSDLISLRAFYIPASIFAYLFPALIVGFWFGFARQFTSGLGLCIGPDVLGSRWPLLAPITAVVFFNFIVLITVGAVILRSYLATRHTRFTKSTNLLVLIQLMLTLGMPYMLIYVQIISPVIMILILPVGIAVTALFMFLLVAVIDDDNRRLLVVFLQSLRSRKYDPNSENMKNTVVSETITSVDQQMSHNHHFFARSRNHFLRPLPPSMMDDSSNVLVHNSDVYTDGDRPPILVPLEVPSPHRMAMQWDTADCHQPPATSTAALVLPANEKY
uniref:Cadherin EGF LAG seven-pass G-type receptor 1 n=1 Tax=Schistocephalus solidus TaxID=70667 RepID=A0A0V0J2P6_SCHSO